ncbi:hypothetical protein [Mycobacterium asiaticum]|uniref:hypothetical protein n=1 Tax=Mycobacterium asiaticum TaxID=1790 RepID=UPI00055D197A|nr:hypothetical protein [Mycobacterium asiaticum]ORA17077.1 hypothetical protein BST16_05260 [Mycobacterium asiaticum DSM 44297]
MTASELLTSIALSRGWQAVEQSERTGYLGAVDEWQRDGVAVRVFYTSRGGVRTGWIREGNRDWTRVNGQDKLAKIERYLKTGYLS